MFWMTSFAFAGSVAGFGVPGVGGGFAGPAEHGALGVAHSPTAALSADAVEIAVDVGLVSSRLQLALDSWDHPIDNRSLSPQPTVMAAASRGDFGIGLVLQAPYVRGANGDPEGPQRLYSIRSSLRVIESDVIGAYRPLQWLAVGAGLRVSRLSLSTERAVDTGALLNASLHPEPALPIGDPLLEGTQSVDNLGGTNVGWLGGVAITTAVAEFQVSFRPPFVQRGTGEVAFVPSNDLAVSIEGVVEAALVMPASLSLSARVPLDAVTLFAEAEWVGWQRTGQTSAEVSELALTSTDSLLDGILASAGLDRADFVTSQEGRQLTDQGWRNVVNLGAQVAVVPAETIELRAGIWHAPSAVRDAGVNPGNLDFTAWDLRGGVAWQSTNAVRVALSADRLLCVQRVITRSTLSQVDAPDPSRALPPADGRYALSLWRAGLTLILTVPSRSM